VDKVEGKKKEREYYILIPATVLYDTKLNANEKLLYGEISSLCHKEKYCWATNDYFQQLYKMTKVSISRFISNLAKEGYIKTEYVQKYNKEKSRYTKGRKIYLTTKEEKEKIDKYNAENREKEQKSVNNSVNNNPKSVNNSVNTTGKSVNTNDTYNSIKDKSNSTDTILIVSSSNKLELYPHNIVSTSDEVPPMTFNHGFFDKDVKEEKKQPKKEKVTLSLTEQRLLKVIETLVYDKDLHFNHRLPEKDNGYKVTNLIKKVMKHMDNLLKGTFIDSILLEEKKKEEYNLTCLQEPLSVESLEDLLWSAMENWKKRFTEGYEPKNKVYLSKVSLDSWFYNDRNQYSWFLECLHNEPKTIRKTNIEQIKQTVPTDFLKWFDKLYQYFDMSEEENLLYYAGVKEIYIKHENLALYYDDLVTLSGWRHYLSTPEMFAQNFYMFLRDYPYAKNVKMLSTTSGLWRDWRRHVLDMWHVDMSPNPTYIKKLEEENERKLRENETLTHRQKEIAKNQKEKEDAEHLAELLD
jgi:hypothetical protein